MRIRLALAAVVAAAASLSVAATPASACAGYVCDRVNAVCHCLG